MPSSNIITKTSKIQQSNDMAREANSMDFCLPELTNCDEKRGTNAELKAPSANKLLNRLGSLNDTKKASETLPAPRKLAISISLKKPVTRLTIVNPPKVAIDFINDIICSYKKLVFLYDMFKSVNKGQINFILL